MKCTGHFVDAKLTLDGQLLVTFSINEKAECIHAIDNMVKDALLSLEAKVFRKHRSKDANALLWACLGEIAHVLNADKWDVYLMMLRRYGQFTYIVVKKNAVEAVKAQWRECEEIGTIDVNGTEGVQLLCYFGSSTYNTKEFSQLLDGVISEMKECGLQPPTSQEMKRSLELWEKSHSAKK